MLFCLLMCLWSCCTGPFHDIGRRPLCQQFPFHEIHVGSHMSKESFIPSAEVIESRFTFLCVEESIFRTLSIAGKEKFTLLALVR